ncbi:virulence factor [Sphingomonas sp. XMGL2]|uniref:Virulence factor n=2 Tax=Sphingomonas quercus TaxID=2842451 RepID=A0ABS6BM02_9SPHN|nr:virulence factor [Sphingomonas quercus]
MLALLLLVAAGMLGFATWLGYFGGALYVPMPATAAPAPGHEGLAAVLVSGDMGIKVGMGPRIARRLADHGIPVLAVNSLVYFRERRTPAEAQALLADAVRRGLAFGHARRLLLVGQSYGADMVHVGLIGLPRALREKLAMVALVVPTDTVMFRASPAETLGWVAADAAAVDSARRLDWLPVLCVHGKEETDSLCPLLHQPNVRTETMPGGHKLDNDADGLFARIVTALDRALQAA